MNEITQNYCVLIVEDDPIIARVLATILNDCGYRVDEPVNSGEKAIARVAASRPDIVLMDIDLLGWLSGIDTARIILHMFSTPVIFVTGHDEEMILLRAKDADPYGFLLKPISRNILNATIQIGINLHEKICSTTEGKRSGLTQDQRNGLGSPVRPVMLLDELSRIIWMNDAAEFLIERPACDLILADITASLVLSETLSGDPIGPLSDTDTGRPLYIRGTSHNKQVIPRISPVTNPFGDIGGYFLEFMESGE